MTRKEEHAVKMAHYRKRRDVLCKECEKKMGSWFTSGCGGCTDSENIYYSFFPEIGEINNDN